MAYIMANASELLHFMKQDRDIKPFSVTAQVGRKTWKIRVVVVKIFVWRILVIYIFNFYKMVVTPMFKKTNICATNV